MNRHHRTGRLVRSVPAIRTAVLHSPKKLRPAKPADRRRRSIWGFFTHLCICMAMNESPAIRLTMEYHRYPVISRREGGLARHLVTDMLDLHHIAQLAGRLCRKSFEGS